MSYIDIGIIAFLVLFGALGVWKGVQKSALALGAFLISFVIAFFLANVVAEAFLGIDSVREFVMGTKGWSLFNWIYDNMGDAPWAGKSYIAKNFYSPIYEVVRTSKDFSATFTPQMGVALCAAFTMFSAIIGIGLFIVIRALMCIVTMIVKSYIPRKKSVGNRVGALFVGMVRGGVWAFVITIVFSTIGGFGFAPAIDAVEDNYESAVMANHLNDGAYGIKNAVLIPSEDMFSRLVIKFKQGVKEEKPSTPDPLDKKRKELYVGIINLNYTGDKYSVHPTTGEVVVEDVDAKLIDASDYADSGFDIAINAIIGYNNNIGASIIKEGGSLADADIETLNEYETIRQNIWSIMYGGSGLNNALGNYMLCINDEYFGTYHDQDIVDSNNATLKGYYDVIVDALDRLKVEYAKLTLFTEDDSVGNLSIPQYPEVIQDSVVEDGPAVE